MKTELDIAIDIYQEAIRKYDPGHESYSVIELPKLKIADLLLQQLHIPLEPIQEEEEPLPRLKQTGHGFVYLMRNKRNGYTKIGWSVCPQYREKTLQSEEPEIELLEFWQGSRSTEFILHAKFSVLRLRGEWFNLKESDIEQIRNHFKGTK